MTTLQDNTCISDTDVFALNFAEFLRTSFRIPLVVASKSSKFVNALENLTLYFIMLKNGQTYFKNLAANHKTTTEADVLKKIAGVLKYAPDNIGAGVVER